MLGLQETKSAGTPSSKTYSCVACSATFNSLSSLLVHQASHASEISDQKAPTLPSCSHCSGLFASLELLQKHHCMLLPSPVTQHVYVCDCGEEFNESNVFQEHKQSHESKTEMELVLDETSNKTTCESDESSELLETSEVAQMDCGDSVPDGLPSNENSHSYYTDESPHENTHTVSEESISASDSLSVHNTISQDHDEEPSDLTSPLKPIEAPSIEEPPPEELLPEEPPTEAVPPEEPPPEELLPEEPPTEAVPPEEPPPEELPTEALHPEEPATEALPSEEPTPEKLPTEAPTQEELPPEELTPEESPTEAQTQEELPPEDLTPEELPTEAPTSEEVLPEELTSEALPVEEPTPEASPTDAPLTEALPTEGLPIEDLSIEDEFENLQSENTCASDYEETPDESQESQNKNSLLKMLASAYMSCRQPVQKHWGQRKRTLPPRKVSPRAPMQDPALISASSSGFFMNQLRQKVAKYGPGTQDLGQSGDMLNVKPIKKTKKKRKRIISTTKTLYPVVALETCQKLFRDNIEGRHQCGLCRRVFQDMDSLIMHHALHKKERVKFCRRCREYVITVISVPLNHICSPNVVIPGRFLSANSSTRRSYNLFHCTLCNRSYTRRHNLNKHNCQWRAFNGAQSFRSSWEGYNAEEQLMALQQDSSCQINVGVDTVGLKLMKAEELSADSPLVGKYQTGLLTNHPYLSSRVHIGSAKSFPPFRPSVSKFGSVQSTEHGNFVESTDAPDEARDGSDPEADDSVEEVQWIEPLDDAEIDVIDGDEEKFADVVEVPKESSDEVIDLEHALKFASGFGVSGKDFQVHISDSGVKRFSCNRCQRTYSRRFTVRQHLKICGARKLKEQPSFGNTLKKKFPCSICGASFTRKYRMNLHRRRCHPMRSAMEAAKMLDKKNLASQENVFVLPPVSKNQVKQESGNNNSANANWGLMSLPSVLPRKVTCECSAVFNCPRLLFEHLQLHALESYICSHCGENLHSWADFEAHQKFHGQTSKPQGEQKVSTPQQPQAQQAPRSQSPAQNPKNQSQDSLRSRLNHRPLTESCVCYRCKKIFGSRKSMLRHLRLSCRGDLAGQKKHSCSRCGMTFQSPLAHKVHVQGNTCTPSFKPIRCPVCVRWFSCMDGLKRHLVSHSQQKVLKCQICEHKCSSQEDLEDHKRRVHVTTESAESSSIQSAHVSQSNRSNAFRCQICQRSYSKLQSLKDHLRKVHRPQGLNPISIGACEPNAGGFQFSVGTVQQGQPKQFQCHICSRTYPDIQSLKNHKRRVHRILGSGIHPSKGSVQLSHSNQFQCHICSRSYPDLRSLRNHRRRVHRILGGLEMFKGIVQQSQGNPYRCHICQRSYPDVRSLKNHRRRVHRILGDVPESAKVAITDVELTEVKPEPIDVTLSPSPDPEIPAN